MANNRIFLCHRPTGRAIMLGKCMLNGMYKTPTQKELQEFFDDIYHTSLRELEDALDLCLCMERGSKRKYIDLDWNYSPNWWQGENRLILKTKDQKEESNEH